ncbi:MAG: hypothetical protein HFH82_12925 [Lachnospiraceae bacterium]|nr:hypothetical protein [Lachnospiraceae bacterium]
MNEKNSTLNNKTIIRLFFQTLFILLVTKVFLKYWLIPNITILYFIIAGILLYSLLHLYNVKNLVFSSTAILLNISVLVAYLIKNEFSFNANIIIVILDIILLLFSSYLILNFFCNLFEIISYRNYTSSIDLTKTGIGKKSEFILITFFIFAMWFPYFLTYYPGLIFGDSLNSIYQALGIQNWNNHFPILYTFFIKICIKFGLMLGNINLGYAFYTIIQMIAISCILSYVVCWLKHKNIIFLSVISCIYYAFEPSFPQHAIAMWKDGIFSVSLLYLCTLLFDLVLSKGELLRSKSFLLQNIISIFIICFFRNNGVYIIAVITISMLIYTFIDRQNYKEKIHYILTLCTIIFMVFIITGPIYKVLNIEDDEVEKYGILLQQMARTVTDEGNIGTEELEFLNKLLPIEKYNELYHPQIVDPLKWDKDFNKDFLAQNQLQFIKIWFKLLIKNPDIYIKAYLEMTYQYWTPNVWENNHFKINITSGNLNSALTNPWWKNAQVKYYNILSNKWFDATQIFSLTTPMIAIGILVWFMILVMVYASIKKQLSLILSIVPCLGVLITLLIATPTSYWPRYMLVIYYMLPIFISIIPIIGRKTTS